MRTKVPDFAKEASMGMQPIHSTEPNRRQVPLAILPGSLRKPFATGISSEWLRASHT